MDMESKAPEGRAEGTDKTQKWYYSTTSIIIGFLCVGPLILPLVWLNPNYSWPKKVIYSVVFIVLTVLLVILTIEMFQKLFEYISYLSQG